jgi:hypothetical protein
MNPTSLPVPWPAWLAGRVPTDRPFTYRESRAEGVTDRQLAAALGSGHLVSPLRGIFHAAHLPDGLDLRIACLRLVVPADAVITDRTAGWLHGAPMILAPNDHLGVPRVSMYRKPGYRLRNGATRSGERTFGPGDVVEIDGLQVTSVLRTTCDLGRLLHRDQAIAAMDSMMRVADFSVDVLLAEAARFKGQRGIRQFRHLAPLVDPRSQSPGESILKLRWRDCLTLPVPTPQLCVQGPDGPCYLDLAVEALRYAAEYDGARWHGPEQRAYDQRRRNWLAETGEWLIDVFVDSDISGREQNAEARLIAGVARATRRLGSSAWRGQDRA